MDWDSESEGAWAVDVDTDSDATDDEMPPLQAVSESDDDSMPDLETVSNSSDGDTENDKEASDWFSEVGEDAGDLEPDCGSSEELSGVDGSERSSFVDVDPDSDSVGSWDYVRDALVRSCTTPVLLATSPPSATR